MSLLETLKKTHGDVHTGITVPHTVEPWEAQGMGSEGYWIKPCLDSLPEGDRNARGMITHHGLFSTIGQITGGPFAICKANTRRIVACINACEGVPTDALERGIVTLSLPCNECNGNGRVPWHLADDGYADCGGCDGSGVKQLRAGENVSVFER